jgi:uncharacterized membrane protein YdbT with pleckstrin-like domain
LLALGAALLAVASFVPPALRWWRSAFAVTDRRVLAQVGVFSPHVVEAPLGRATAVRLDQNVWGRLLGYATLRLVARDGAVEAFPGRARGRGARRARAAGRRISGRAPAVAPARRGGARTSPSSSSSRSRRS